MKRFILILLIIISSVSYADCSSWKVTVTNKSTGKVSFYDVQNTGIYRKLYVFDKNIICETNATSEGGLSTIAVMCSHNGLAFSTAANLSQLYVVLKIANKGRVSFVSIEGQCVP